MAFMNKDLKISLSILIVPDKLPELEEVSWSQELCEIILMKDIWIFRKCKLRI